MAFIFIYIYYILYVARQWVPPYDMAFGFLKFSKIGGSTCGGRSKAKEGLFWQEG
jgi:hypothetical protein